MCAHTCVGCQLHLLLTHLFIPAPRWGRDSRRAGRQSPPAFSSLAGLPSGGGGGAPARSRLGCVSKRGRWAMGTCVLWGAGQEGVLLQGRRSPPFAQHPRRRLFSSSWFAPARPALGPRVGATERAGAAQPRAQAPKPGSLGLAPDRAWRWPTPSHTRRERCVCTNTTSRRHPCTHVHTHMHVRPLSPAHPPRYPSTAPGK